MNNQTINQTVNQTVNQAFDSTFFEQWSIYQQVISNNYMYHAEIIDIVNKEIDKLEGPVSILELGCGDAYVISRSIAKSKLKQYYGVDASNAALSFAKENLQDFDGEIKFVNNDFLLELESLNKTSDVVFDVIIIGYALHHLTTEKKEQFFSLISEVLAENGLFIFYDIEMNVGETCEIHNERACSIYPKRLVNFSKEVLDMIGNHVRTKDIPETEIFYLEALQKVGFSVIDKTFRDENELFAVYVARR